MLNNNTKLAIGIVFSETEKSMMDIHRTINSLVDVNLNLEYVSMELIYIIDNNIGLSKAVFLNKVKNELNSKYALILNAGDIVNSHLLNIIKKIQYTPDYACYVGRESMLVKKLKDEQSFNDKEEFNAKKLLFNMHYLDELIIYNMDYINSKMIDEISLLNYGCEYALNIMIAANGGEFKFMNLVCLTKNPSELFTVKTQDLLKLAMILQPHISRFIDSFFDELITK